MSDTNITITKIIVYKFYSLLGHSCRILFSAFSAKKLVPEKEVSDLNLLLFTGLKGGKMLKAVLISIYNTWEKIPLLTVVTDGTPTKIIEEHLKFWPYPYKVKTWEESAAFHLDRSRKSLVDWCRINVFARKLLAILAGDPQQYVRFADEYYERRIAVEDVAAIYRHEPLTTALVHRLNPDVSLEALATDADGIGYPES